MITLTFVVGGLTGERAQAFTQFPDCVEHKVLRNITKRFNRAERDTWHRGVDMLHISNPHGHGHFGFRESPIQRQYCHAYAHLSDGKRRKVYYLIEEGMGFAGFGWRVQFCIPRYDPWRIYDGYCRTVRPQ